MDFLDIDFLKNKHNMVPGSAPGQFNVSAQDLPPKILIISYNKETLLEQWVESVADIKNLFESHTDKCHWISVRGFGNKQMLEEISDYFSIHKLEMEDVVSTFQRPKLEEYPRHLFLITRMLYRDEQDNMLNEQLSLFVGQNFVLSFQERYEDIFDPIYSRLKLGKGFIRDLMPDYLAYALMDNAVDNYFPLLETTGDRLDDLESVIITRPNKDYIRHVQQIKRQLIIFRRTAWAERDKLNDLLRTETPFLSDTTKLYLRDTYDHCIQVMDLVESYKEITSSLMDIYLSSASNRMNQIMKVLAVISTIFIPLTFIVGVYGMNFSKADPITGQSLPLNMPELYSPYGYIGVLAGMLLIVTVQLIIFYRKGWLTKF